MKSLVALLLVVCCTVLIAGEPPLPIVDCGCCDTCKCVECKCAETGVRCSFDCTCVPCLMTYCCKTCGCKQFEFPAGRKCEPRIMCGTCPGTRTRGSLKQLKPKPKRQPVAMRYYPANCST